MNAPARRLLLPAVVLLLLVGLGWWLVRDARNAVLPSRAGNRPAAAASPKLVDTPNADAKGTPRPPSKKRGALLDELLGLPNERLVRFATDEAYQRFLDKLNGSGLRLLGRLDRLRALRIGYNDLADLEDLLGEDGDLESNYYVAIPILPEPGAQAGAAGFGANTLEWLGIDGDNSNWGAGVTIAILDTGISGHSAFAGTIREIDLLSGDEPVPLNGHGTAVASLIASSHPLSPGIAPAADLVSIRVGDESGSSNSFLLAQGIITAVDQGAQLVNISMGSYGNSGLVREAVAYAAENNVLIIASSGNQGFDAPAFPAALDGVVAVGAVDAKGEYLDFSNQGVGLTAPGLSVNAAWPGDEFISFSGTSASAPLVTGATAATMSEQGLSAQLAYEVVVRNLNETGAPGTDPQYGDGNLNVGRTMDNDVAGIYNGAVASNYFQPASSADPVNRILVTVENRGTELLTNSQVEITTPAGTFPRTLPRLDPGEFATISLPAQFPVSTESFLIESNVRIGSSFRDSQPGDNGLQTRVTLLPPPDPES